MRKVLIKNYIKAVYIAPDGTETNLKSFGMKDNPLKPGTGQWSDYETPGYLIAWGLQSDDQTSYTVGIIELADGTITTRTPEDVKFVNPTVH